ncbi:MAG: hypothetical protein MJ252_23445, partial [archaeon]|nr:hypothetical protein [archaeon]
MEKVKKNINIMSNIQKNKERKSLGNGQKPNKFRNNAKSLSAQYNTEPKEKLNLYSQIKKNNIRMKSLSQKKESKEKNNKIINFNRNDGNNLKVNKKIKVNHVGESKILLSLKMKKIALSHQICKNFLKEKNDKLVMKNLIKLQNWWRRLFKIIRIQKCFRGFSFRKVLKKRVDFLSSVVDGYLLLKKNLSVIKSKIFWKKIRKYFFFFRIKRILMNHNVKPRYTYWKGITDHYKNWLFKMNKIIGFMISHIRKVYLKKALHKLKGKKQSKIKSKYMQNNKTKDNKDNKKKFFKTYEVKQNFLKKPQMNFKFSKTEKVNNLSKYAPRPQIKNINININIRNNTPITQIIVPNTVIKNNSKIANFVYNTQTPPNRPNTKQKNIKQNKQLESLKNPVALYNSKPIKEKVNNKKGKGGSLVKVRKQNYSEFDLLENLSYKMNISYLRKKNKSNSSKKDNYKTERSIGSTTKRRMNNSFYFRLVNHSVKKNIYDKDG